MSSEPDPFFDIFARMRARDEADAAKDGLSYDEYIARRDRLQRERIEAEQREEARRKAEAEVRRARMLREKVADGFEGRIRDAVRELIRSNTVDVTMEACAAVLGWWDRAEKPILILSGGTGNGKTVASVELIARHGGDFVRARELAKMHDPWKEDREAGFERLEVNTRGLFVLDDLGTERLEDPRFLPALEDLIDARQGISRRTLITTNLSASQFRERYKERFADRLNGITAMVSVTSGSMRRSS